MAGIKKNRELLKLKANDCKLFNVTVVVEEKDFLRDSFMKALPAESLANSFAQHRKLRVHCNRQGKTIDYRAFVDIHPSDEKSKMPKMHFHVVLEPTTTGLTKGEKPPFAEEIFQWLSSFVSLDANIELSEQPEFEFPTNAYRSAFSLPLLVSGTLNPVENEAFEGSHIVGVSIDLQANKTGVQFAQQSVSKKSISIRLRRHVDTTAQKLITIENDVAVLRTLALSTLRPIRKTSDDTSKRLSTSR